MRTRVIPCLLLENTSLVKTVCFRDEKYIGDPINTMRIFNEKEVDEIILLDITATIQGREPPYRQLEEIVSEAFMPVAYGGGVKTVEQARRLFNLGVEKVSINTAALERPAFITELASEFGSQSVIISIDARKSFLGSPRVYSRRGRVKTKLSPSEWAKQVEALGAGEILITSIEHDGTMKGYNLMLLDQVARVVTVPVIVSGGASSVGDFIQAKNSGASACAAGSMFVFQGPHRAVLISYPDPSDLEQALGH